MWEIGIIFVAKRETPHLLFALRSIQNSRAHVHPFHTENHRNTLNNWCSLSIGAKFKVVHLTDSTFLPDSKARSLPCHTVLPRVWVVFIRTKLFCELKSPGRLRLTKLHVAELEDLLWVFQKCMLISINEGQQRGSSNWSDDWQQHSTFGLNNYFPQRASLHSLILSALTQVGLTTKVWLS